MTCPRCHSEFEITEPPAVTGGSVCPECGLRLLRNVSGVMKTSAVMIVAQGEHGFYRSVQDVPEPLRTQLLETTTSPNSGTIVIADRAGKEQLTQVMARREAGREGTSPVTTGDPALPSPPLRSPRIPWLAWAGFTIVLAMAALIYTLFQFHW